VVVVRRAVVAAAALATLVAGCQLLFPLGRYDEGTQDDGGAGEASADAPASAGDGSSGGGFCAQHVATFCDDFDDDAGLPRAWGNVTQGQGSVSLDDQASLSPRRSLLGTLPASTAAARTYLSMSFSVPNRIRVDLDLRVDANDDQATGALFAILLSPPPPGFDNMAAELDIRTGLTLFTVDGDPADGGPSESTAKTIALTFATWQRVGLEITIGPPAVATLYGGKDTSEVLATLPMTTRAPQEMELRVGLPFLQNGATSWRVRTDDVVVVVE
jgi:hypothetical protein